METTSQNSHENEREPIEKESPDSGVDRKGKCSVGYVYCKELTQHCNKVPNLKGRASLIHTLIESYGLLKEVSLINCNNNEEVDLSGFHSYDYINTLKGEIDSEDDNEEYGLGYDCPPLENLYDFVNCIAKGSISAARALISGQVNTCANFCGGWHHAQRDHASGFCYVNDCVLAILELQKKFHRVLYIDLDIHHGDGVENAFAYSKKVFTLSIHKYEEGYFPGTGSLADVGLGSGRYYTCNVPLKDGASDATYFKVFKKTCEKVVEKFQPEAIVCQCGADSLVNDPMGTFNLTLKSYRQCVRHLKQLQLPLLILGGGGYNLANAARCFTSVLAVLVDKELKPDIPESELFDSFGPAFELEISTGLRRDENTLEYVDGVLVQILRNLENVC